MESKRQLSYGKLFILVIIFTVIWILCYVAEQRLPVKFEQNLIERMGGTLLDQKKINMALVMKNMKYEDDFWWLRSESEKKLLQTYNFERQQQLFCIVVRDFARNQPENRTYTTARSIAKQDYKNFKIIYLIEPQDPLIQKIRTFMVSSQISKDRFNLIETYQDDLSSLLTASEKCPRNGIILLMENMQIFTTTLQLKVINTHFRGSVDLTWASSLYQNDKVGFSFDYSEVIKAEKSFRKYPYAARDVMAFRNSLFIRSKQLIPSTHFNYPLSQPEAYGYTLLEQANSSVYIPEILTIKLGKIKKLRIQTSQEQLMMEKAIRKGQQIERAQNKLQKKY